MNIGYHCFVTMVDMISIFPTINKSDVRNIQHCCQRMKEGLQYLIHLHSYNALLWIWHLILFAEKKIIFSRLDTKLKRTANANSSMKIIDNNTVINLKFLYISTLIPEPSSEMKWWQWSICKNCIKILWITRCYEVSTKSKMTINTSDY